MNKVQEIYINLDDSGRSYVVQAADLLAETIRQTVVNNEETFHEILSKFVDFKIILP